MLELLDEPDLNNSELVEKLLLALQVAKEAVPEMKIQIVVENRSYPMSAFETLAPYTDVWCLNDGRWNDAQLIAFMEEWQQGEGKELWFYACSTNLRENPTATTGCIRGKLSPESGWHGIVRIHGQPRRKIRREILEKSPQEARLPTATSTSLFRQ